MMAARGTEVCRERNRALPSSAMNGELRRLVLPAVILGIVLLVVAVIYFVQPEHSLPGFFPGHASPTSAEANHHHTKHGIAALIVALACFAFAWFQTGPKTPSAGSQA
jgi:NADH:ubiquinone oxidoreductase subunit 5 (subunit L)/multisubunit Na+/H+ antiporter MnhA subunit